MSSPGLRLAACSAVAALAALPASAPAAAAPRAGDADADAETVVERVYRLERQTASAAVGRVCPLLSPRGSVEVLEEGRTLVVRDLEANVGAALARLAAYDRAGRVLRLAVQIVRADADGADGATAGGLPAGAAVELAPEILERLQRLLRYRSYSLLARAELEAPEEAESSFEVGSDFRVSFRLERSPRAERVRMSEFRVLRRNVGGDLEPLVHTRLSLETGRPMILGLAPTEASERALVVVLEAETEPGAAEARG